MGRQCQKRHTHKKTFSFAFFFLLFLFFLIVVISFFLPPYSVSIDAFANNSGYDDADTVQYVEIKMNKVRIKDKVIPRIKHMGAEIYVLCFG